MPRGISLGVLWRRRAGEDWVDRSDGGDRYRPLRPTHRQEPGLRGSVRRDRQLRVECTGSPDEFQLWFDDLAAGFHEVGVQCCALSGRVGHAVRAWLERDWPFHSIEYAPRV